jgi:hypothetical protein
VSPGARKELAAAEPAVKGKYKPQKQQQTLSIDMPKIQMVIEAPFSGLGADLDLLTPIGKNAYCSEESL